MTTLPHCACRPPTTTYRAPMEATYRCQPTTITTTYRCQPMTTYRTACREPPPPPYRTANHDLPRHLPLDHPTALPTCADHHLPASHDHPPPTAHQHDRLPRTTSHVTTTITAASHDHLPHCQP
ncbi:Hypothetical predicted protein [Pelobates cultripes]|uniref:Uncharacterized protein n=1 Tax=Pelobates cultripes TaxID=61616 RepID=A0AAD1VXT8_PELCU|nr:Hypothetical predicted protein [Pelobates cultripes]